MLSLVSLTSTVLGSAAVVTPDAASLFAGAVVLLVALLWERRRLPTWSLAAAGGLATGLKYTNMAAVGIVAAWLLVQAIPTGWAPRIRKRLRIGAAPSGLDEPDLPVEPAADRPQMELGSRRYLTGALVLLAGAVAVALAWAAIDHARAVIDASQIPQNREFAFHGVPPFDRVFSVVNVFAFFPPFVGYEPAWLQTTYVATVYEMLKLLFSGAMLVAALRFTRRSTTSVLATVGVVLLIAGGPLFMVMQIVVNSILNDVVQRYGMSAIPIIAVVAASFVRGRISRTALWGMTVVAVSTVLITLATAPVPAPNVR